MTEKTGMPALQRFLITYTEFSYNDIKDAWLTGVVFGRAVALYDGNGELSVDDFGTWLIKRFAHLEDAKET